MAEEKKHRPLSSNDREIEILKKTFGSNNDDFPLLKAVRSLFLGFPIKESEITLVKSAFKDPQIKLALRKKLYPILDPNVPIGEESDFWFGTEKEIVDKMPETIKQVVMSKQRVLEMLEVAFNLLDNPRGPQIDLHYDPRETDDLLQIGLLARNKYVQTVVTGLTIVKVIAGQTAESVQQAKERLMRDSAK